ncbi:MAG: TonB-dependent receptor family protein, partial [Burkholderiales bacterium]
MTATDQAAAGSGGSLTVPPVKEQRKQLEQTVGSVAFVDAASEQIQTRHVENLADALKNVPGVYVQDRHATEIRLSLRGCGLTRFFHLRCVELLQDGIPVNLADGSGDFEQIDPLYFRSIEVYKGGNALMFGTSTLGGAINFVSPTAYTALAPDLIRIDGGSFGSIRNQVQVSRVIGNFDFLINGTFAQSKGYRDHSESTYGAINGNIGYRFAPGAETRFYFGNYDARHKIPGQLTFFDALNNPTRSALSATRGNIPGPGGVFFGGNQARDIFDQRIANKTTLLTDWGLLELNSWFIYNTLYHPIFQVLDQYGYTAGFAPRFTATTSIGGFRNDIIVGGRIWAGNQADRRWTNLNGFRVAPQTLNARNDALNLEIYGEDRFFVAPDVALMAGLKLFSDSRKQNQLPIPSGSTTTIFNNKVYDGILPKAGVIWFPTPDIQVFGDFTGSADVPDFTDLTQFQFGTTRFVPLKAQRAWTGEIGTRGRWDRFFWDATAYRADIRNELVQFTTAPGAFIGAPPLTFNAPHTVHQGIEFAVGVDLLRDLWSAGDSIKATQIWTLNDFFFVNDREFGNNKLAGAPPNVLRTILAYNGPNGLYIAPSLDWAPVGAFADYANTIRTPGYTLLG